MAKADQEDDWRELPYKRMNLAQLRTVANGYVAHGRRLWRMRKPELIEALRAEDERNDREIAEGRYGVTQ